MGIYGDITMPKGLYSSKKRTPKVSKQGKKKGNQPKKK